ncbi:MAG: glycosyltransferase family 4 protein [Chloroflexi bacterium]|nr:glycosyltransferase family 4 protein [Chloroflexota bacterium]
MHVLFLTPGFPPFPGGGERYARALALILAQHGHQVTVVTSTATVERDFWRPPAVPAAPAAENDGPLQIVRCPLRGMPGGRPVLLAWRKAMVLLSALPGDQSRLLLRMARRVPPIVGLEEALARLPGEFDLVHAFNVSWEYPMAVAWVFAGRRNLPLVITPFAHLGVTGADRVTRNWTMDHQRRILAGADAVLALTSIEQAGLARLGIPPERLDAPGSGLDPLPATGDPAGALQRYQLEQPLVLFIGRASHDKGAIHAARAIGRLRRQGLATHLALIGQVAPEFHRYYRRLGPADRPYIHPLGLLSDEEKHTLLEAASLLVLPSRTDSFGIVLLEAWAHGKAVVGARAGGIPGVIDEGRNGLLVEFGDVAGLAVAIKQLLTDESRRQTMGQCGREKVLATYTWDQVGERVLASYRRALRGVSSARYQVSSEADYLTLDTETPGTL